MRSILRTAVAASALATALPAAAHAQETMPAIQAPLPNAEGKASVEGGDFHYQVYGDLASGQMPLLVLHGSFMTGDSMWPIVQPFVADRPVIVMDQRGHGRTGDLPGGITYELLADDAAAVLAALKVETVDVLGYSMGANAAILMAVRHPERVGKLIALSGTFRKTGWYPAVLAAFDQWTPEAFVGGPLEASYKRLSPTPEAFPTLVEELKILDTKTPDVPDAQVGAVGAKTMVIIGDADGVTLDHAVALFKLRGGGDEQMAVQGIMSEAPGARLAILPATTHVGILGEGQLIHALVTPFLNDTVRPTPEGIF